jgi:hypothetical protein
VFGNKVIRKIFGRSKIEVDDRGECITGLEDKEYVNYTVLVLKPRRKWN